MFLTDDKLNDKKKKRNEKNVKDLKKFAKFTNWMEILLQERIVFRWIMKWKLFNCDVGFGIWRVSSVGKVSWKKMTLYIIVTFEVKLI